MIKEVTIGIAVKSKEQVVSLNQLEIAMYSYNAPACNCCSQMHVRMKHSLVHLQDLIPTLADIKYIGDNTSQSRD